MNCKIFFLAAAAGLVAVGCSQHTASSGLTVPSVAIVTPPPPMPSRMMQGYIYLPTDSGASYKPVYTPRLVAFSEPESPAKSAIRALISAPHSPLPSGTQLRSIRLADGEATVDLSRQFKDNFHGGDTGEAETINAILETLGQFPAIETVRITVDGKSIDSLGGTIVLSDPLDVIRPADPVVARMPDSDQ